MVKFNTNKSGSGKSNKGKANTSLTSNPKGYFKSKKAEMKFSPLDSKSSYAHVPYTTVKEAFINAIRRLVVLALLMWPRVLKQKRRSKLCNQHFRCLATLMQL
jgi:hypothetical protein